MPITQARISSFTNRRNDFFFFSLKAFENHSSIRIIIIVSRGGDHYSYSRRWLCQQTEYIYVCVYNNDDSYLRRRKNIISGWLTRRIINNCRFSPPLSLSRCLFAVSFPLSINVQYKNPFIPNRRNIFPLHATFAIVIQIRKFFRGRKMSISFDD